MSKLVFISDVHIGAYQEFDNNGSRLQRCFRALDEVYAYAIKNHVEAIIDCGDLIDRKNLIDFRVYNKIYDYFKQKHVKGVPFYTLTGNHNIAGVERDTNLHPLNNFINIVNIQQWNSFNNVVLSFIPYQKTLNDWWAIYDALCEDIRELKRKGDVSQHILVAHQEIKNAITGTHRYVAGDGLEIDNILPGPFDWCIFGHYHLMQVTKAHVFYCGALLQQEFGEENNPQSFFVYDTEKNTWTLELLPDTIGRFRTTQSKDNIPAGTPDFWRLRVTDAPQLVQELEQHVRVEIQSKEQGEDRLNLASSESFEDIVRAYLSRKGLSEHEDVVLGIIKILEERKAK